MIQVIISEVFLYYVVIYYCSCLGHVVFQLPKDCGVQKRLEIFQMLQKGFGNIDVAI